MRPSKISLNDEENAKLIFKNKHKWTAPLSINIDITLMQRVYLKSLCKIVKIVKFIKREPTIVNVDKGKKTKWQFVLQMLLSEY